MDFGFLNDIAESGYSAAGGYGKFANNQKPDETSRANIEAAVAEQRIIDDRKVELAAKRKELAAEEAKGAPSPIANQIKAKQDALAAIHAAETARQGSKVALNRYLPANRAQRETLEREIAALRKQESNSGKSKTADAKKIADLQRQIKRLEDEIQTRTLGLTRLIPGTEVSGSGTMVNITAPGPASLTPAAAAGLAALERASGAGQPSAKESFSATESQPGTSQSTGLPWGWILAGAGLFFTLLTFFKSKK